MKTIFRAMLVLSLSLVSSGCTTLLEVLEATATEMDRAQKEEQKNSPRINSNSRLEGIK